MNVFAEIGQIVTVPAGSGYAGVPPVVLVSRMIPTGTTFQLEKITAKVMDIGSEQITFSFRRNGTYPIHGLTNLSGAMFDDTKTMDVGEELPPGLMEIVAFNKSGTTEPGAVPAVSATCHASFSGVIHPQSKPAPLRLWDQLFPTKRSFYKKLSTCLIPVMGIGLFLGTPTYAEPQDVTPGVTTARSAKPVACVNPTTLALESCGGAGGGGGLTDAQLRATPVPVSGTFFQATQPVSLAPSTAMVNGQQAVTASAVALPANSVKEVCVKAMLANTINVYVGTAGVTITTGLELSPGDAYCVQTDNSSDLLVIASTTGASVSFAGRN